ncbi:hypothetical protein COCOR_06889 [Corallococcus coralloides DSM 2259]|uniref:Uncharacterized protein n=1 Tax=Corallococcus coralloides (strain ATCC 25202 / DSM 2259 / NBRC 100086 / M2) TaxID=1144275 RepID=H8N133_CORCM|nr:hypothetical protein [Corallococcus coralloides]AFE07199.1 hypothetical protein COCOR_06889 [Corallococcus coralloides DSM 2259]
MPCYTNVTDEKKISEEINAQLQEQEKAMEVLQLISNLCWETEISNDPMSQWLGLLSQHVPKVQKWKTSEDLIEIYPSGTRGKGRSDRLLFQVGATQVAVVSAFESKH